MMKCQLCERVATFHITDLTGEEPREIHLCQEHFAAFAIESEQGPNVPLPGSLAGAIAQQFESGALGAAIAAIDSNTCPTCGLSFYQFRQGGRLGCPHDYAAFESELEALLASVHGQTRHVGKRPRRHTVDETLAQKVTQWRRELDEAVAQEDYEEASRLRDAIQEGMAALARCEKEP